jgi:signal transduction histidine kinase
MQATQSGAPVRDKGYVARLLLEDSHTTLRLMNPHRDRASVPADQVERLLRADRHKDESLAIVAHELRGPLGAVQNAIAVLRSPRGSDATVRAGMYELIDRQVRQMSLLTTGLLEIGRITRGELALQHSRIDLLTVLNNAVETVEPEFTRRRQPFTTNWSHSSVWVLGDASRLEQVFVNLLTNASKYTDEGGQIRLSVRTQEGHVVVGVKDSGIGISAATLPNIFDLYMQVDAISARSGSGVGVGLALVRKILDLHGGDVTAHSPGLGQGSEFVVRLRVEC